MIFKLSAQNEDGSLYTVVFDKVCLPDIIQEVLQFLRGCGFFLKNLDYDNEE